MAKENYPRPFLDILPNQAGRWVSEGIITEEQRKAILTLYPTNVSEGRERTTLILSILGSSLVGIGIILFLASNWPVLPALLKLSILAVSVVSAYAGGYHLAFTRGDYPRLGHSIIFLGALLYGASIWLVAQMFHLDSHFPNGFLLWALGVLPMAWAVRSKAVLYLGTGLLLVWNISEQSAFSGTNWLFPPLMLGAALPLGRRLGSSLVEAAAAMGLGLWFTFNLANLDLTQVSGFELAIVARFTLLYGAAVLLAGLARLGDQRALTASGAFITLASAYALTFEQPFRWGDGIQPWLFWGPPFLVGSVVLVLGALGFTAWRYWQTGEQQRLPVLAAVALILLSAGTVHLFNDVGRMIFFNLLLFGGNVGMVLLGIYRRSELLVNLALVAFVIHIFTRYVDLFFSAMDRSLFFVLGGLLLLGGGWWLERNRRRWIGEFGGGGSHE